MSQIAPGIGPPFVGKASGITPNLFWRRITFDQLRAQQQYNGLPPLKHLRFESTADFRQVRQESQLWTQLHQGLLTTGRLNAALGFYEPAAAKRLGIPRDRVSHNAILSAISNLQLPAYGLQLLNKPAAPVISVQANTAGTGPPQGLQNAITVSEYEAEAIKLANAAADADVKGNRSKSLHKRRRPHKHKQQQQQTRNTATATGAASASSLKAAALQEESSVDIYASADARRRRCQLVAGRGEGGLRMAWGSTQEAAALFSVMHLFPTSQLEEVGLCWVDPTTQIPPEWGIPTEDLPPLGASPDGLIRHRGTGQLPEQALATHRNSATKDSASPGSAAQGSLTQGSATQGSATHGSIPPNSATQGLTTQNPAVSPGNAVSASAVNNDAPLAEFEMLLAKLQISSAQAGQANSAQHGFQSQPAVSFAAANPTAAPATTHFNQAATNTALSAEAVPFRPTSIAQQSSWHGTHTPRPLAASSNSSSIATTWTSDYTAKLASSAMSAQPAAADSASSSVTASVTEADKATPPQQVESEAGEWLEAVEIKNVCPFREARDVNSNGRQKRLFRVSDPGPYMRVPCHFVPQLQMEMLASGAKSALVVSRSATQGVRVFRMQRHADFLKQMLHTISQLYTKYVKSDRSPPPNVFIEQAAYQQFLRTTLEVAASAEIVLDTQTQALPDVQDCSMFL